MSHWVSPTRAPRWTGGGWPRWSTRPAPSPRSSTCTSEVLAQDLSGGRARQLVDERVLLRDLVLGDPADQELGDLVGRRLGPRPQHQDRPADLAPLLVGYP